MFGNVSENSFSENIQRVKAVNYFYRMLLWRKSSKTYYESVISSEAFNLYEKGNHKSSG